MSSLNISAVDAAPTALPGAATESGDALGAAVLSIRDQHVAKAKTRPQLLAKTVRFDPSQVIADDLYHKGYQAAQNEAYLEAAKKEAQFQEALKRVAKAVDGIGGGMSVFQQVFLSLVCTLCGSVFVFEPFANELTRRLEVTNVFTLQHVCILIMGAVFGMRAFIDLCYGVRFRPATAIPTVVGMACVYHVPRSVGNIRRAYEFMDTEFSLIRELHKRNMTQYNPIITEAEFATIAPIHVLEDDAKHKWVTQCAIRVCEPGVFNLSQQLCSRFVDTAKGFVGIRFEAPVAFCSDPAVRAEHCRRCAKWKETANAKKGDLTRIIARSRLEMNAFSEALFITGAKHIDPATSVEFSDKGRQMRFTDFYGEAKGVPPINKSIRDFFAFFSVWFSTQVHDVRQETFYAEKSDSLEALKKMGIRLCVFWERASAAFNNPVYHAIAGWARDFLLWVPESTYNASDFVTQTELVSDAFPFETSFNATEEWTRSVADSSIRTVRFNTRTLDILRPRTCPTAAPTRCAPCVKAVPTRCAPCVKAVPTRCPPCAQADPVSANATEQEADPVSANATEQEADPVSANATEHEADPVSANATEHEAELDEDQPLLYTDAELDDDCDSLVNVTGGDIKINISYSMPSTDIIPEPEGYAQVYNYVCVALSGGLFVGLMYMVGKEHARYLERRESEAYHNSPAYKKDTRDMLLTCTVNAGSLLTAVPVRSSQVSLSRGNRGANA